MLTPKERLFNSMRGKPVDRPPCICPGGMMNMVKKKDANIPVIGNLTGPISLASSLLEPMDFYKELRTKNMAAHEFMAFVTENLIAFGSAMVEAGADVIAIADPSGTGEILDPRMFRDFAVPYLNKLLAGVALVPGGTIVHMAPGHLWKILRQW